MKRQARALPLCLHNPEAESATLGAALIDPDGAALLADNLLPSDFVDPGYQTIFAAMQRTYSNDSPIDPVLMLPELQQAELGDLPSAVLSRMARSVPHAHHLEHYAKLVFQAAKRRSMVAILEDWHSKLIGGASPDDVAAGVEADLQEHQRREWRSE